MRNLILRLVSIMLHVAQISLRPAQSFLLNKNQVPKLQPQIPNMMPPSAQPPRTQTPPLGQVIFCYFDV